MMELTEEKIVEILNRLREGEKVADIVKELRHEGYVWKGKGLKHLLPPEYHDEYLRARESGKQVRQMQERERVLEQKLEGEELRQEREELQRGQEELQQEQAEPRQEPPKRETSPQKRERKRKEKAPVERELVHELSQPKREKHEEKQGEDKKPMWGSLWLWASIGLGGLLAMLFYWKRKGARKGPQESVQRPTANKESQTMDAMQELLKW